MVSDSWECQRSLCISKLSTRRWLCSRYDIISPLLYSHASRTLNNVGSAPNENVQCARTSRLSLDYPDSTIIELGWGGHVWKNINPMAAIGLAVLAIFRYRSSIRWRFQLRRIRSPKNACNTRRSAEYETRDDRAAAKKGNITKYNVLQDSNFTPDMELHANLYRGQALENLFI